MTEHHYHIVALEIHFCPIPDFSLPKPYTYEYTPYTKTLQNEIAERIHDASVIIITTLRLDASVLSADVSPKLQFVAVMATGTDKIDLEACRARGIIVSNCGGANATAVAEHAIGMYFSTRRRFVETQDAIRADMWIKNGTLIPMLRDQDGGLPLTCKEEVLGLIGYGTIGKQIAHIAKLLGMRVNLAERKNATAIREGRVSFQDVLRKSTVIVIVIPRTPETAGLIGKDEIDQMSKSALIVNVSRGGIVDEAATAAALQTRKIAGAAFDVYGQEPAGTMTSPLLSADTASLNLLTTPHTAWLANSTLEELKRMVRECIEGWVSGTPVSVV